MGKEAKQPSVEPNQPTELSPTQMQLIGYLANGLKIKEIARRLKTREDKASKLKVEAVNALLAGKAQTGVEEADLRREVSKLVFSGKIQVDYKPEQIPSFSVNKSEEIKPLLVQGVPRKEIAFKVDIPESKLRNTLDDMRYQYDADTTLHLTAILAAEARREVLLNASDKLPR